jgi:hypothetical protein
MAKSTTELEIVIHQLDMKRSFLSAYGPLIALIALIVIALIILFNAAEFAKSSEPPPASSMPSPPAGADASVREGSYASAQKQMMDILNRTKGNWNKATPDEQLLFNQTAQGHGREAFDMRWKRIQEDEKESVSGKTKISKPKIR